MKRGRGSLGFGMLALLLAALPLSACSSAGGLTGIGTGSPNLLLFSKANRW